MTTATPTRLLADKLIQDGVDSFIADRRAERKSWRRIALDLRDATNGVIDVTPETVRKWATSLQAVA
jgi:hypothetical protein